MPEGIYQKLAKPFDDLPSGFPPTNSGVEMRILKRLFAPDIMKGNAYWGTAGFQAANGGLMTDRNRKLFAQNGISFYE